VQVNLAYRWFCKLGLEEAIPGSFGVLACRNERLRDGDVFRRVFERVVEACIAAGLVGGEGFAVDASLIQADAKKQRLIAGQDWHKDRDPKSAGRAVKEYLATLEVTAWGAASDVVLTEGAIGCIARRFEIAQQRIAHLIAPLAGLPLGSDSGRDGAGLHNAQKRLLDGVVDAQAAKGNAMRFTVVQPGAATSVAWNATLRAGISKRQLAAAAASDYAGQ
jgi:hypothetical protein